MNIATHVLKKDIRHSRLLLGVWLFLVVLQCVIMGVNSRDGAVWTLGLLQGLILLVLVPRVVQNDPLVGTTAFWFTRPISRLTLLESKTLFVLLVLVLIPLLGDLVVLIANGTTGHDIFLAVPEVLMEHLAFILCVATLAVVTPDFGRLAIVAAVSVVGLILLAITIFHFIPEAEFGVGPSLTASRAVACYLMGIFGAGAMISHQYLARKTMVTAAGAIGCALLILGSLGYWKWDFLKPKVVVAGDTNFDASAIKVSVSPPVLSSQAGRQWRMETGFGVLGIPKGYGLSDTVVNPRLKLSDGNSLNLENSDNSYPDGSPESSAWEDAFEAALGGAVVVNSTNAGGDRKPTSVSLQSALLNLPPAEPTGFSARVDFVAYRYVVTVDMAAAKGSRYDQGSEHLVITDVRRHAREVTIFLRQRKVNLLLNVTDNPVTENIRVEYLLVNKKRREAFLEKDSSPASEWLVNRPVRLSFETGGELAPKITPEWLADATLERIEWTPVAAFSRELAVDKFSSDGKSPIHHSESIKPNAEALSKITLPENATRGQAREYVNAVMFASRQQSSFGDNDPQVGMLEKVGPQNLGVLVEFANLGSDGEQKYVTAAIKRLARPEDEALILKALAEDNDLVELVVKYGWEAGARDTLTYGLTKWGDLPVDWIRAVVALRDPSTYPALKSYLVNGDNPQETFDAIKGLPGFDLPDAIDEMWQKARHGSPYDVMQVCELAARYGHADAVEIAADILKKENDTYDRNRARQVIMEFTAATGDDAALAAWVESNRGKLVFDKQSGKFVPQK